MLEMFEIRKILKMTGILRVSYAVRVCYFYGWRVWRLPKIGLVVRVGNLPNSWPMHLLSCLRTCFLACLLDSTWFL